MQTQNPTCGGSVANREMEIPQQMSMLENAVAALEEVAKTVGTRVSPILRPPEAGPAEATTKSMESTPLGQWLASKRLRIEAVTNSLLDIVQHCEI